MKVLMTGGGTAGHVTPNIALLPILKENGCSVDYIGTKNGIERELITNQGINYHIISAGKLRRYFSLENFSDILKIGKGFIDASSHIKKIKPDVVFSKGGFVSCPVVWAAWTKGIPVVIHESDITPGLANKLSMPFAKKICYAFPDTKKFLPKEKSVFAGIPVRDTMLKGSKDAGLKMCNFTNKKPIIVVIGGSLGSKAINDAVRESLDELIKDYQICHICGKNNVDDKLNNIDGYKQYEYINDELKDFFAMADIIISRAGATTLYEILSLAKPNILIPLPKTVSRGDQVLNSNFFESEGYSKVLDEEEINSSVLKDAISLVLKNKESYINNMKASEIRNSSDIIYQLLIETKK